jgi:transcriptional regulator with XRE-family HTH domain
MVTFLHDALRARGITIEQLADHLQPTPEETIRTWFTGSGAPSIHDLPALANALHISPVELICGWLIDQLPTFERNIREITLDPLSSDFPRSSDLDLRAPTPARDMSVEDPFDARVPGSRVPMLARGRVLKVAAGRQKRPES